jgi:hypothetical protein
MVNVKVIKVSGCSICPYCRNHSSVAKGADRKCIAVDDDEPGYGVDISIHVTGSTLPSWCPLEDER